MGTGELMDLDGSCVCEKLFRPGTPAVRVYQVSSGLALRASPELGTGESDGSMDWYI